MKERIEGLRESFEQELKAAGSSEAVEKLRVAYLGKKGSVTELLKGLKDVGAQQKKELGQHVNLLKRAVEQRLSERIEEIKAAEEQRDRGGRALRRDPAYRGGPGVLPPYNRGAEAA